jgi:hypothetical protein
MSGWSIYRRWGTNTTSRKNAFYQTFHIRRADESVGVGISHWGALDERMVLRRPVDGGQLKATQCTMDSIRVVEERKAERGYKFGVSTSAMFTDEYSFRSELTMLFGAAKRDEIILQLGMPAMTPTPIDAAPDPTRELHDAVFGELCATQIDDADSDERLGSW